MKTQLAGALVLAAMAATAVAGQKYTHPVTFDANKPFVFGSVGDARNSADAFQYIGCVLNGATGFCYATDSAGVGHSCSTTDPDMLSNIRAINGYSSIAFKWNPTNGLCTLVMVYNDSARTPK